MKENTIKAVASVAITGALAYFQALLIPLIILVVVVVIDYITGMANAFITKTLSSRIGVRGIFKKLGFFVAVGVACVVDWMISSALISTGIALPPNFAFAILVCVWLIINDCISILENLNKIGVPLPGFLLALLKRLKDTTEKKVKADIVESEVPNGDQLP